MEEEEIKTIDTILKWINNDEESYCTGKDIKALLKIAQKYTSLYREEKRKNKRLEEKLNYLKAIRDCNEEFEL